MEWKTYEAEAATTSGQVLGPEVTGSTAAREASGRSCVKLAAVGQFVEFKATEDAQGLVVRYSLPDSADGVGQDASLTLYVNGTSRGKLALTSRLSHLYGPYPFSNNTGSGSPRNFWDEVRSMPGEIRNGDTVRLQRDAGDAVECLVDSVDLERVPGPITMPAGFVSVTEFGATANDASDDHGAFVAAIKAANAQGKGVWIPAGTFVVGGPLEVSNVTVRGAGMWYSNLVGVDDYLPKRRLAIYGAGSNIALSDFALTGKVNYRNDSEPNDGIGGSFGTGSSIRNIWVEHTKAGAWLVNSEGLVVEGCRFRNTIADGINLCLGMRNTVVRNCTARGTGDDCFAMWPATYSPATYVHGGNRFVNCTAQVPFLAQGFSIYGGEGNLVESCEAIDIPYGAGAFASTTFPTVFGFRGETVFRHLRVVRAGGGEGALGMVADGHELPGVRFEDVDVIGSPNDGVKFTSIRAGVLRDAVLESIRIVDTGGAGIASGPGALGSAKASEVSVTNAKAGGWRGDGKKFVFTQGEGNSGLAHAPGESDGKAAGSGAKP